MDNISVALSHSMKLKSRVCTDEFDSERQHNLFAGLKNERVYSHVGLDITFEQFAIFCNSEYTAC